MFVIFTTISYIANYETGKIIFKEHFFSFFKEMILFLPIMFVLIGLCDVWISKEKVTK